MIKGILAFLVLFGLFFFGIQMVLNLSKKAAWGLTKLFFYSIICASLVMLALATIVILF